jgi:hypothetical protein
MGAAPNAPSVFRQRNGPSAGGALRPPYGLCRKSTLDKARSLKSFHRDRLQLRWSYLFGASQASVTALSMMCRSTLWHLGQLKVRKSLPNALGSIAISFIGEPQAAQHGP